MAKQTKAPAPKTPTDPAFLKANKPASANGAKVVTEEDVIAFLELQDKGSDILKKARNVVWRKITEKEADPDILKVLRKLVSLKTFDAVKRAWSVVRKENAPVKAEAEKEVV